jgi:hypothetical protein
MPKFGEILGEKVQRSVCKKKISMRMGLSARREPGCRWAIRRVIVYNLEQSLFHKGAHFYIIHSLSSVNNLQLV